MVILSLSSSSNDIFYSHLVTEYLWFCVFFCGGCNLAFELTACFMDNNDQNKLFFFIIGRFFNKRSSNWTIPCLCFLPIFSSRKSYLNVDDTDPFLPRPPQYDHSQPDYGTMGHSSPRPWSERGTLQHGFVLLINSFDSHTFQISSNTAKEN